MRRMLEGKVAELQLQERRSRIEAITAGHWRQKTQIIERIQGKTSRIPSEQKGGTCKYLGPLRMPLKIDNPLIKGLSAKYLN